MPQQSPSPHLGAAGPEYTLVPVMHIPLCGLCCANSVLEALGYLCASTWEAILKAKCLCMFYYVNTAGHLRSCDQWPSARLKPGSKIN